MKDNTEHLKNDETPMVVNPDNAPYLGRQAYLFAALVIARPLIELVGIISYIYGHPDVIEKCKGGWRFRVRPPLDIMLRLMPPQCVDAEIAKDIRKHYGHIVYGNTVYAEWNHIPLNDGWLGYAVGKVLNQLVLCDEISLQGRVYLQIITSRAMNCFPEVRPHNIVVHHE